MPDLAPNERIMAERLVQRIASISNRMRGWKRAMENRFFRVSLAGAIE
jgi:hypothetical protein